jgi:hypothetical protein
MLFNSFGKFPESQKHKVKNIILLFMYFSKFLDNFLDEDEDQFIYFLSAKVLKPIPFFSITPYTSCDAKTNVVARHAHIRHILHRDLLESLALVYFFHTSQWQSSKNIRG